MKYRIILITAIFLIVAACEKQPETAETQPTQNAQVATGELSGEIIEVLQTPSYTYLKLKDNVTEKWVAVSKMEVKVGETLYYQQGMEMKNFESKTLNKTFPSVWFVAQAGLQPMAKADPAMSMTNPHGTNNRNNLAQANVKIESIKDGITIAQLFGDPSKYEGKVIKIKGKVTKFNSAIMNRNWVHLQDGTEANGKYDLTVTTLETVKVGDIVVFEGKITLNKDFGAGYKYDIIMEESKKN